MALNMWNNSKSSYLQYVRTFLLSRQQRTVLDTEVPEVFREPGVTSGYRPPNRRWSYYLSSIFHLNNETINIWSHLLGCIFMVYQMYSYAQHHGVWADESRRVVHVFNMCGVIYTFLSTLAHTLHNKSEFAHYMCFQADYMGISLNSYSAGLMGFYIGGHDAVLFHLVNPYFLTLNAFLAWLSFLCCSYAKFRYTLDHAALRKLLQVGSVTAQVSFSCFPVLFRFYNCFHDDNCGLVTMLHHIKYLSPLFVSAIFFSSHIPEKIWPGKFDFIGQGHQIFHVLVLFFSYYEGLAVEHELQMLTGTFKRSFPTWTNLVVFSGGVITLNIATMFVMSRYIRLKLNKTKDT